MVGHLVLYEFKPGLPPDARERFHDALAAALASISSIRATRVGRRLAHGAGSETGVPDAYSYFALLEFDDADGLRSYLEHPAHAELASRFWEYSSRTLVHDFELAGTDPHALRAWI